jgi:hypothetical protein
VPLFLEQETIAPFFCASFARPRQNSTALDSAAQKSVVAAARNQHRERAGERTRKEHTMRRRKREQRFRFFFKFHRSPFPFFNKSAPLPRSRPRAGASGRATNGVINIYTKGTPKQREQKGENHWLI